ncbi:MAG TPA: DUF2378 family protein [Polyangiaceae bacterium]|jgi:uncharacterized protein (TIGR02265 family)
MPSDFVAPDWDAPLDVAAYIDVMPPNARIKGMYAAAIVDGARARGIALPTARERYLAFQDVPMREFTTLLVEAAGAFFPQATLRSGLRRLGRSTHGVFAQSVVGRVVLSTANDPSGAFAACAKAYAISLPPSHAELREDTDRRAVFALANVYNFLDSHHIGVLEGVAHSCGLRVTSRVKLASPFDGEIELTW